MMEGSCRRVCSLRAAFVVYNCAVSQIVYILVLVDLYSSGHAVMLVYTCGLQIQASQWYASLLGLGWQLMNKCGRSACGHAECLL